MPFLKENGGAGQGRGSLHLNNSTPSPPLDNENLCLNPVDRTWALLMNKILQTNSTQQNF